MIPESLPETSDGGVVERKLPSWQDADAPNFFCAQLSVRIEQPQVLDFLIELIDALGIVGSGCVNIDQ